jgi:hypothetical protein
MHISGTHSVVENKNTNAPSFPSKTIRIYLINNKLNYNFQLVLLFCFKMHAFVFTRENNAPLKVLLSQSQSAISPEVMLANNKSI